MASSTPVPDEPKKPSSTRSRKTTPRSRPKKNENKKPATPRRRASPRNLRKTQEEQEKKKKEKEVETPPPPAPPVKEEKEQEEKITTTNQDEKENQDTAAKEETEMPLAQDTLLRRTYLQRIYRQLQSTHPNQDDTVLREFATNVEMETCQKATTRSQYVEAMDQQIYKLMQFEMEQANASVYTNGVQGFDNVQCNTPAQSAGSAEMQGGYSQSQISQSRRYEYAQALAKAQEQEQANGISRSSSFSTPRQSMNGETSFQSLMGNQNQGYGSNGMQQQQNTPSRVMSMQNLQQMGSPYYPTSSMVPPTSQSFSIQSNVGEMSDQGVPRNMMEAQHFQMQSPYVNQSGPIRPQHRVSNFQEFSAQIQHLEKSVLIELLWNQRSALAQWQRQAKQLKLQLSAQQNAVSNMGSPGFHSSYNSPMVGGGNFVSPNISGEAEMQRAREHNNTRNMQQQMPQYSYMQQSNGGNSAISQAGGNGMNWGDNAQVYWDKVRALKTAYVEQLRIAKTALANNTAPPNSVYSEKAKSVMNNIGLVIGILNEPPTNVQPRKFDVLTSIERFIQITVVPIVRKVQSSYMASASQTAVTSGSFSAADTSVATFSPGMLPSRDGLMGTLGLATENEYAGAGCFSSNSNFSREDSSRQSSNNGFAEPGDSMNTPTGMMDGLAPPVENSPTSSGYSSSQYAPIRPESNDIVVMGSRQPETQSDQTAVYDSISTTAKESSSTPASEFRLPTISEVRPSPRGSSSPSGLRDNKVMQSSEDDLNAFADFPELAFDEDSSNFVKENNPSNISRKRGIEDV